jgi:phosphatidylglycerol:prolipoprotein diacylglycerol transferase
VSIHWYGIFFALGVFLSSSLFEHSLKNDLPQKIINKLLFTITLYMLVGAKLGYLVFYTPLPYWGVVITSLKGLSFHGGLIGLIVGLKLVAAQYSISFWALADRLCLTAPWGLLCGRIGNFMNSELFGRPTLSNWGVIFMNTDSKLLPRHPSQLYEAATEGLLLGLILAALPHSWRQRDGMSTSIFLIFYGLFRCIIEEFREPDPQIGFLAQHWTMGQILSTAMIFSGLILFISSMLSSQKTRNLPIFDRSKEMICALRVKKA